MGKTTHQLDPLVSLVTTAEIDGWDVANSKAVKFTVGQVLEMDNLESLSSSNMRLRNSSNSNGGGSRNLLFGYLIIKGAGDYNAIFGANHTPIGSGNLIGGLSSNSQCDYSLIAGEGHSFSAAADWSATAGLNNQLFNMLTQAWGQDAVTTKVAETAWSSKMIEATGDNQLSLVHLQGHTLGIAPVELLIAGDDCFLATDAIWGFEAHCVGVMESGSPGVIGDAGYHILRGLIKNVGGTVTLVGSIDDTTVAEDAAAAWGYAITADNVNKKLKLICTPQIGQDVKFSAHIFISQAGHNDFGAA